LGGGGGKIGVPLWIDRYTGLEFLCITQLELRSVKRNDPSLLFAIVELRVVICLSNRQGKILVTVKLGKVSELINDVHGDVQSLGEAKQWVLYLLSCFYSAGCETLACLLRLV